MTREFVLISSIFGGSDFCWELGTILEASNSTNALARPNRKLWAVPVSQMGGLYQEQQWAGLQTVVMIVTSTSPLEQNHPGGAVLPDLFAL